jgi:hypothetical protein
MKKLLLTTALAGATLVASNAIAQTTVSGNLDISFKAISGESTGATGATSHRGFGKEAQINIQNKGKLNNGMDYAAGFAIEDDGNQTNTLFNENTYIDFISGNTTLTIGQDHIQHSERTLGNFVGLVAEDLSNSNNNVTSSNTGGTIASDGFLSAVGSDPAASFGVGIMQKTPVGTFSALYVPSNTRDTNAGYGSEDGTSDTSDESAYEIGFVGDLGVKGLSAHAFMNKEQKANADTRDNKGQNLGLSYNFGQITAGYNYKKTEYGTVGDAVQTTSPKSDTKQHEYGLAYAVSPNLSIGANYTKAENSGTGAKADAESRSIAVGYNLGAIALTAQVAQLENIDFATGASAKDFDVLYLRASTKF